uniref:NR LBD domain-containing protein n=1 Tax=Meloidogyne incognita TaxID=6306 RepID=A0A914ML06_MELIC
MPRPISSTEFYEESAQFCQFSYRIAKFVFVHKLICIGIFKALPAFPKLDVKDQIIIFQYVAYPVSLLCSCFVSYELGSRTMIGKDGFYPMAAFAYQFSFKNDKTLFSLANKVFNKPIEPFFDTGISKEEFSLILAIVFLNPDIPNLSESGRIILSNEFSYYSKMLLNYLHNKLGIDAGTKKYAECIHLITASFIGSKNFDLMVTYQEAFYKHTPVNIVMPNCLKHS